MKLQCWEVMGGEGDVFSPYRRGQGGHHNGATRWKRLQEEGREEGAGAGRAEFNTKHCPKTLSLGAPAKSSAATF